uniref:Uncharacterized protein n=1 Tax=Glossina morsitans morsitans TaxID=37546 RepID=A0A1B0FNY3_GLOMM
MEGEYNNRDREVDENDEDDDVDDDEDDDDTDDETKNDEVDDDIGIAVVAVVVAAADILCNSNYWSYAKIIDILNGNVDRNDDDDDDNYDVNRDDDKYVNKTYTDKLHWL